MKITLNNYQRSVLARIGDGELANGDECNPSWWVEGGDTVRAGTASALIRAGMLKLTRHAGGHPGVDYFRLTDAGRLAAAAAY